MRDVQLSFSFCLCNSSFKLHDLAFGWKIVVVKCFYMFYNILQLKETCSNGGHKRNQLPVNMSTTEIPRPPSPLPTTTAKDVLSHIISFLSHLKCHTYFHSSVLLVSKQCPQATTCWCSMHNSTSAHIQHGIQEY